MKVLLKLAFLIDKKSYVNYICFRSGFNQSKMDGCGILFWYPSWLARFANTRCYMIIFGLLGTIQEIAATYLVVTLTTMEKRFKIPSQTTGECE